MRPEDFTKGVFYNGKQLRTDFEADGKVLNGGAITEEEARTLIRTAGGMNGVMIGNYLTSKGSDPQDDIAMLHDLGRTQTAPNLN